MAKNEEEAICDALLVGTRDGPIVIVVAGCIESLSMDGNACQCGLQLRRLTLQRDTRNDQIQPE